MTITCDDISYAICAVDTNIYTGSCDTPMCDVDGAECKSSASTNTVSVAVVGIMVAVVAALF